MVTLVTAYGEWAEGGSEGGQWSHKGNRTLSTLTAVKNFSVLKKESTF